MKVVPVVKQVTLGASTKKGAVARGAATQEGPGATRVAPSASGARKKGATDTTTKEGPGEPQAPPSGARAAVQLQGKKDVNNTGGVPPKKRTTSRKLFTLLENEMGEAGNAGDGEDGGWDEGYKDGGGAEELFETFEDYPMSDDDLKTTEFTDVAQKGYLKERSDIGDNNDTTR